MRHLTPTSLQDGWEFADERRSWLSYRWTVGRAGENIDAWVRLHTQTVKVSRQLLIRDRLDKIRAVKNELSDPSELNDADISRRLVACGVPGGE
jgi:hypothetical protein